MARTFTVNTNYLSTTLLAAIAMPLTISVWVNRPILTDGPLVVQVGDSGGNNYFGITFGGGGPNPYILLETNVSSSATDDAQGSTAMSATTWTHLCGIWASATSRTSYLNGTGAGTGSTSHSPTGTLNKAWIGLQNYNGTLYGGNESLAFFGLWSVALSATDVASLAAGASPKLVQPSNLVAYCRVDGIVSPEPDLIIPAGWTVTGTPPAVAQPRIFKP